MPHFGQLATVACLSLLLFACASPPSIGLPEPLREPKGEPTDVEQTLVEETLIDRPGETQFTVRENQTGPASAGVAEELGLSLSFDDAGTVDINFDNVPLPVFINAVFGSLLNLSFQMDSAIRADESLVTLRASEGQTPEQLFGLAEQVLDSFGVQIVRDQELLRFIPATVTSSGDMPLLVSGRTLPDVPPTHRPVFQFVNLNAVQNAQVRSWLQTLYGDRGLTVQEDPTRNAVILQGPLNLVRVAMEAIDVLDQPAMRGRLSLKITPAFRSASELASELFQVLQAEGYAVSDRPPVGAIFLISLDAINSVVAFAGDQSVIAHIKGWAEELDRPPETSSNNGVFLYEAQNTSIETIASVVNQLLIDEPVVEEEGEADPPSRVSRSANRLIVDAARNSLLFQGEGSVWMRLRPIIQRLDKPTRLALVEVTVAEVTLTDEFQFGIEWALERSNLDVGTEGGLGIGGSGLNFFIQSDSGRTRAVLNAFASSDRVSILSTPRLMVQSGEEATIDVGTEVPIITSSATAPDLNNSILQNIVYRKTGVRLRVRPIIHASNRIDLEVSQEVSESQPNASSGIDSPQIFDRSIETSLSLRDGGSVMLGGLITGNESSGEQKVPFFGDIPFFGRLFRTESQNMDRTELIVVIVPYIIDGYEDAEAITRTFRERLNFDNPAPLETGAGSAGDS